MKERVRKQSAALAGVLFIVCAAAPIAAQTSRGGGGATSNSWLNLKAPDTRWAIGAYGGYARNTLYVGVSQEHLDAYHLSYDAGNGMTVGLPARFRIFNWLAVQAEFSYTMKNYAYNMPLDGKAITRVDVTNHFIDFPIMANLSYQIPRTGLEVFANLGFFMGLWAGGSRKGKATGISPAVYDFDEAYEFDDRRDNRFDAGFLAGLGLQYDFKPLSVFAEWRYNYGFTDLQKKYYDQFIPNVNDTWTISLGVLFNKYIFGGK